MYVNNGSRMLDHDDPDDPIRELMTTSTTSPTLLKYVTLVAISGMIIPTVNDMLPTSFTSYTTTSTFTLTGQFPHSTKAAYIPYYQYLPFDEFVRKVEAYKYSVLQVHNRADQETVVVKAKDFLDVLFTFDNSLLSASDDEWEFAIIPNKHHPDTLDFSLPALEAYYGSRTILNFR